MVASTIDPDDGRRRLLALTAAGRALVGRLTPLWAPHRAGAESSQKSPALVELSRQMLTAPDRIWDGAFSIWQQGETDRSRTLQPFQVLGFADRQLPGSARRMNREAACE